MTGEAKKFLERLFNAVLTVLILFYVVWLALAYSGVGYYVPSESMKPVLMPGDLIVIKPVTVSQLVQQFEAGEEKPIIVFNNPYSDKPWVHRIYRVVYDEEGNIAGFQTKGDNNQQPDSYLVKPEDVRGEVVFRIPLLGYPIMFVKSEEGKIFVGLLLVILILSNLGFWAASKGKSKV